MNTQSKTRRSGEARGVHLWLVLWKASHAMEAVAQSSIGSLGLCLSDFAVLEALLHKGPLPVNEIGRKVMLTSGSITTAVDRLARRGLAIRREDEQDRRTRVVHLTPRGGALIRKLFAQHARDIERVTACLTPGEAASAARALRKLGLAAEAATETSNAPKGASKRRKSI